MDAIKKLLGTPLGSREHSPNNGSPADNSSTGDFVAVPPGREPTGDSPRNPEERRRSARINKSEEEDVDPYDDEAGEEDDLRLDSDADEQLDDYGSEGENSSIGSGRPVEKKNMKHLTEGHCRMGTQVSVASGAKVSCACGRLSGDCNRHKTKRESGRYARFEVGFYPIVFSSQGHQSHGKIGTQFLSEAGMEEQIQVDLNKMTEYVEMQQDNIDLDEEEELESLKKMQDSRTVKFGGETNDQEKQFPTPPRLTGLAPTRLEAILTKTKTSEGRWHGLIDPSDNRVVVQGIQRCEALEDHARQPN